MLWVVRMLVAISIEKGIIFCEQYDKLDGNFLLLRNSKFMLRKSGKRHWKLFVRDNDPIWNSAKARKGCCSIFAHIVTLHCFVLAWQIHCNMSRFPYLTLYHCVTAKLFVPTKTGLGFWPQKLLSIANVSQKYLFSFLQTFIFRIVSIDSCLRSVEENHALSAIP